MTGSSTTRAVGLRPTRAAWSTLDGRFWMVAAAATLAALVALGVPTAVIPNPFFTRMTPTEPFNVLVWLASALLIGPLVATYARTTHAAAGHEDQARSGRATAAGIASFLAIGCPVCNKIVVAALGVSGAMSVFAPLQPLIGAGSVALLAATLVWRLRARARPCEACAA